MRFTFGRDLAHQNITGFHFGTDVDDPRLIQAGKLRFRQVGNVARDFFRSELRITSNDSQFFDVN